MPLLTGRQGNFVINDIDLYIPPQHISVRKEDLEWKWKTLRSKASTKIPSGHGMAQVSVKMTFTPELILDLHRLIVQFRHSPFCYVDSEYLRHAMVPHWPQFQQMAFTMSSLHVEPMPKAPNTYVVQLDLRWFNYFPYSINYLFRDDWVTRPVELSGDTGEFFDGNPTVARFTIPTFGVGLRPLQSLLPEVVASDRQAVQEYDVMAAEPERRSSGPTLHDLEATHRGSVFDLLPLPSNMAPARFVTRPSDSNIYVRYINTLQQKALFNNFGIDVYSDITEGGEYPERFEPWGIGELLSTSEEHVGTRRKVYGLHELGMYPSGEGNTWVRKMHEKSRNLSFVYHSYKSVELSQKIQLKQQRQQERAAKEALDIYRALGPERPGGEASPRPSSGFIWPIADEYLLQDEKNHVGEAQAAPGLYRGMEAHGSAQREGLTNEEAKDQKRFHKGLDIRCPVGTPVRAVADGFVVQTASIWENPNNHRQGGGVRLYIEHQDDEGTYNIISGYAHLDANGITVKGGDRVTQGQIIGITGDTGNISTRSTQAAAGFTGSLGATPVHLHFSIRESISKSRGSVRGIKVDPLRYYKDGFGTGPVADRPEPVVEVEKDAEPAPEVTTSGPSLADAYEERFGHSVADARSALSPEQQAYAEGEAAKKAEIDEFGLTPEEKTSLQDIVGELYNGGWRYYENDADVLGVWRRLNMQTVYSANNDIDWRSPLAPEDMSLFYREGMVLTGVSGGLSHVIASIPILGSEFPTHQHLGSIEPIFQFEFVSLANDDKLAGLSDSAQWLEGMRSELQYNSRRFRPVPDCWTASTDHFITRLFGTFSESDAIQLENGELQVKKRTSISSSETRTIDGNPGLSGVIVEVTETNPYGEDPITPVNNIPDDLNVRRKEILHALDSLALSDEGETAALLALANKLDASTVDTLSQNPKFATLAESSSRRNTEVLQYTSLAENTGSKHGQRTELKHSLGRSDANQNFFIDLINASGGSAAATQRGTTAQVGDNRPAQTLGRNGIDTSLNSIAESFSQNPDLHVYEEEIQIQRSNFDENGYEAGRDGSITRQVVDATRFYEYNPKLRTVNWEELSHYYQALNKLQQVARLVMSETDLEEALDEGVISEQLYDLPDTEPSMWRSFFFFYSQVLFLGRMSGKDTGFVSEVPSLSNFSDSDLTSEFQKILDFWNIPVEVGSLPAVDRGELRTKFPSIVAPGQDALEDLLSGFTFTALRGVGDLISMPFVPEGQEWKHLKAMRENEAVNVEHNVVRRYMRFFDLELGLPEFIFNEIPFLSGLAFAGDNQNGLKLRRSYEEVTESIRASVAWYDIGAGPIEQVTEGGLTSYREARPYEAYIQRRAPDIAARREAESKEIQDREDSMFDGITSPPTSRGDGNVIVGLPVSKSTEENKLRYLHAALSKLADELLSNRSILAVFGLDELLLAGIESDEWTGAGCYPDLELPAHPYYPDQLHQTSPDFYMWSVYEDGPGALQGALALQVADRIEPAMRGAYGHLKEMQTDGGLDPEDIEQLTIMDEGTERSALLHRLTHHPEGCDEVQFMNADGSFSADAGPMQEAFYAGAEEDYQEWLKSGDNAIVQIEKKIDELTQQQQRAAAGGGRASPAGRTAEGRQGQRAISAKKKALKKRVDILKSLQQDIKPLAPLLSLGDGNPLYTNVPRADASKYVELVNKVNDTEIFFGSKQGHLGEHITQDTADAVASGIRGTQLQSHIGAHRMAFDPASLKQLAIDSSKDIVSEKLTMRRAFPTFKLMFVEEDENESRFLNFDDFYSYNGVKEFNVSLDRNHPADTAIIVLQNIAGTLDGTKRNVVTDLDYFDREKTDKIQAEKPSARVRGDSPIQLTSANDQPFGAVVLRPGLNVQLRAGYSDDPNALEVLISGRVVDVVWTQAGDLAEIVVQSFGTELVQILKGRREFESEGAEVDVYQSTHKLLGSLMLEPELKHFGRWEFGQLYQYGESTDSRLDFVDYTRGTWNGQFGFTQRLGRWISHHPVATLAIGTGLSVIAARFGGGALLGRAGRFILGGGGRAGVGAARSAALKAGVTEAGVANSIRTATASGLAAGAKTGSVRSFLLRNGITTRAAFLGLTRANRKIVLRAAQILTTPGASPAAQAVATKAMANLLVGVNRSAAVRAAIGYKALAPLGAGFWQSGGFRMAWQAAGAVGTQFGRVVRSGAVIFAAGATLNVGASMLSPLKNKAIKDVKEWYTRTQVSLMLSPQDDNLFPPSPKDYMDYKRLGFFDVVGRFSLHGIASTVFGKGNAVSEVSKWYQKWANPEKWHLDKRVTPGECEYTPINATIWDMFHEMSLRHPGWVYGARPYGRKFRYTMFFGVPSQRFWSKPASNGFINRINSLREFLDSGEIDERKFITLYGQAAYDRILSDTAGELQPEGDELGMPAQSLSFEDLEKSVQLSLVTRMTNKTLREYLKGLELRFVPFRRYHLLSSDTDIVHNGLMGSEHNVANAVSVQFRDGDPDSKNSPTKSVTMKASSLMPDSMVRMVPVYYPNLKGYHMALRYGQASLMYGLRQMYRGEILVLGNPRIRPWDICFLMDNYHDMIGPVEVERVTHMMSHETGFLTEIKPNAIVFGNEISTWPVIEAMKLYIMAVMDFQDGKTGLGFSEESFSERVLQAIDGLEKPSPRYREHLEEKLNEIVPPDFIQQIMDTLPEDELAKRPSETMVVGGLATAATVGTAFLGYGAFRAVGGLSGKALKWGWSNASGQSLWRGMLGGASRFSSSKGNAAAGALGATAVLDSANWIRDSFDNPGLAWFIAAPILFAQVSKEEAVSVIPLQKNGIPIVAGLSYKDPMMMWKNIQGNVVNAVDDTIGGTRDLISEWKRYGMAGWRRIGNAEHSNMTGS